MHTYATIQDIRDRGISEDVSDEAIQIALERAAIVIDGFTNRDFLKREAAYSIDGNGTESVFLNDWPIVEVLELKVDDHLIDADDYVLYSQAGYIRLKNAGRDIFTGFPGVFPEDAQNIEIYGFFGFEDVPEEVKEAAILLAIEFLRGAAEETDIASGQAATTRNAIGIRRIRIDEISVDFAYPQASKTQNNMITTGLGNADRLIWRFRRKFHATAV